MKYSLICTALTLERHLQMWVAFYTYANTVIVRGVGGALLTIADHKVLAIHVGIVFTHYKTKQRTKIVKIQSHQPYVLQGYFEVEETASCCPLLKALYENQSMQQQKNPKIDVRLTFTSDGCTVFQSLATYITELAFKDGGCRETMGHRILDQSCGNAGAGGHH